MSRLNTPGILTIKPQNNVYTGLACLSFLATASALVYVILQAKNLGLI